MTVRFRKMKSRKSNTVRIHQSELLVCITVQLHIYVKYKIIEIEFLYV